MENKELKSASNVSNVIGYVLMTIGVIVFGIGVYNLISGEAAPAVLIGAGVGSFAFGTLLWAVTSIGKYLLSKDK